MLEGIDISHWNRIADVIPEMNKADFVIMKASEGRSMKDTKLDLFYNTLHGSADGKPATNKLYGFYHFAHPEINKGIEGARAEADNFIGLVGHHAGHALYCLAWEGKSLKDEYTDWAVEWLRYVEEKTGVKPLIYCQASWTPHLEKMVAGDYGLWVAHYTDKDKPEIGAYPFYALWQYSADGIDRNRFNGNEEQWRAYCKRDK